MDYLILLSSIGAGALTFFGFRLQEPRHLKLLNAFTGGYLLTLTMLHLLPELYHDQDSQHGNAHILVGALMLGGFFMQIALDVISMGVEHGHAHHTHGRMPWGVVLGLCLHAFVEAMALGDSAHHHDIRSRSLLLYSIVVHNFPVSIALLGMLMHGGVSRRASLTWLGVFAAMAPCGMFLSSATGLAAHSRELTAIVIGIFMHISTTILFESSDAHQFNRQKLLAIAVGTGLGVLSLVLH